MRSTIIIILLLCLLAACERRSAPGLAQVNGRSISQDDFVFAYETSPRSVLNGSRQAAYNRVLDRMVSGILLAEEAERLGLDKVAETARELQSLEDAAIRRELFKRSVREQINVSDQACRRAFKQNQQTLWVQHAVLAADDEFTPGIWDASWDHVSINPATKTVDQAGFGMVDIISWNDVDLKLEKVLYGLDLNQVSAPILQGGANHVFRLVNVETNIMTSENQYQERREHYQQALQKRQEHALAFSFVQEVMAPEELIIRRPVLEQLTQVIWRYHPDQDSLTGGSVSELSSPDLDLDELNELELASFRSGSMLVEDFRFCYKMNPHKLSRTSPDNLQKDLINTIGIYVRDMVFAEKGRSAGLADALEVREDVQYWHERLLASTLKASIYEDIAKSETDTPEAVRKLAEQIIDALSEKLKQQSDISIDEEMLMSIKTSDEGLTRRIDFFAGYLN